MGEVREPEEVPFPPPPWRSAGQMWMALLRTREPLDLPEGMRHLLSSRWLTLTLVRYLEGARIYDELVLGPLARRGLRPGIWIERIWVDDAISLWGGRQIWGFPKQMASFEWEGDRVRVADAFGPLLRLEVDRRPSRLPSLPLPGPGFGRRPGGPWLYGISAFSGRPARAGLRILEWPDRLPLLASAEPFFGFSLRPFRATASAPRALPSKALTP